MTSFTSIPRDDIIALLSTYNQEIPEKQLYQTAWNFILSNPGMEVPTSIADFIIALTLSNEVIPKYISFDILLNKVDLDALSKLLTLDHIDKERILRILGYLNLLDKSIYDNLPDEIIGLILMNLDCKDIGLACKTSERFKRVCTVEDTLRKKLQETTGFTLKDVSQKELGQLC